MIPLPRVPVGVTLRFSGTKRSCPPLYCMPFRLDGGQTALKWSLQGNAKWGDHLKTLRLIGPQPGPQKAQMPSVECSCSFNHCIKKVRFLRVVSCEFFQALIR